MRDENQAALLRRNLDDGFKKGKRIPAEVPKRGWIYNIREAYGMSCHDLARCLDVSTSAILMMEKSESKGTLRLKSLRQAAKVLNCTLVYALVPIMPLEKIIERRRRRIACKDLAAVLPAQNADEYKDLITAYAQKIKRNRIWRKTT